MAVPGVRPSALYDHNSERSWRHLDTCQYRTILHAEVPRANCPEHGVRVAAVCLGGAAQPLHGVVRAVGDRLAVGGQSAGGGGAIGPVVGRGACDHGACGSTGIEAAKDGEDRLPWSGREGLPQGTQVSYGGQRFGAGLRVVRGRGPQAIESGRFLADVDGRATGWIQGVALDMWDPYVRSIRKHLPDAEEKMVFDKFHVAKHLSEAVDKVRRTEHRQLQEKGDDRLKGTKYDWLKGREKFDLARMARVLPVAARQLEDGAGLGVERAGHEALGFHVSDRRRGTISPGGIVGPLTVACRR